ncbi:MAG: hypothetical protein ACK4TA_03445 [Saprospiraceae bacterium]
MRPILLLLAFLLLGTAAQAQGYAFGLKGGLTVGMQRWDESFQRDPLFRYHGVAYIESLSEDNQFGLFAQLGYHIKGSAIRTFPFDFQLPGGGFERFPGMTIPFEFRNISLGLGGKKKYDLGVSTKAYYMLGIRVDYTASTKLRPEFVDDRSPYAFIYPIEPFVNEFNYGAIFGGGLEWMFSEYVGGVLEFSVNPDFSLQYNQPPIENIINPNPDGPNIINIPQRQIRNLTFEVSLGIRLLHIIEYID